MSEISNENIADGLLDEHEGTSDNTSKQSSPNYSESSPINGNDPSNASDQVDDDDEMNADEVSKNSRMKTNDDIEHDGDESGVELSHSKSESSPVASPSEVWPMLPPEASLLSPSNNSTDAIEKNESNKALEVEENKEDKNEIKDQGNKTDDEAAASDHSNFKNSDNNDLDTKEKMQSTSKQRQAIISSDEDDEVVSPSKIRAESDSEDEEGGGNAEVGVGELMTNIFGEDSDDEKEIEGDRVVEQLWASNQPFKIAKATSWPEKIEPDVVLSTTKIADPNKSGDESSGERSKKYARDDDDDDDGNTWDFDVMLKEKKAARRRPRRRRRDGSIDVSGAYDEQIKTLIDAMKVAAKDDRHSNMERKPALRKRKMLPFVKAMLIKHDLMEAIIDNGMMNVVSEWLAPLPDKSLPALEIRTDLLKILQDYSRLEPGTLKQSGLGRAVMLLYKHPRETKENKALAARLISDWARPIFQLDTDFRSMSKDERIQRDYAQLPEAKRRRLGHPSESDDTEKEAEPRPGDKGFIMRARVPRPSQREYVVRPKSNVEGQFRGATKNRSNSRLDRTQREFKERTRQKAAQRAVGVSINRVNI